MESPDTRPLLERRSSSVRFKDISPNPEGQLEHAFNDIYDALAQDALLDEDELDEDTVWLKEQRLLNKTLHWLRRPSLFMIGITLFLYSFSTITAISATQVILFKLACNSILLQGKYDYCDPAQAEVVVSHVKAAMTVTNSVVAMIAMTQIGALSDKYGRRIFLLLIALSMLILRSCKFFLLTHYDYLLVVPVVMAEGIGSITGGVMTFISLVNCYVADIADHHERSYFMGVAMSFFFVGIALGPMSSSFLMQLTKKWRKVALKSGETGSGFDKTSIIQLYEFDPLRLEIATYSLLLLFIIFVLPESRPEKARRKSRSLSVSNSITNLRINVGRTYMQRLYHGFLLFFSPLKMLYIPKEFKPAVYSDSKFQKERVAVLLLILCDTLLTSMSSSLGELLLLYGMLMLNWGAGTLGFVLSIPMTARSLVLVVLAPFLNHYVYHKFFNFKVMKRQFDMLDFSNVIMGLIMEAICLALIPFLPDTISFLIVLSFSSISALASPALNSSLVKYYPDSKTGELFSAIYLVKNISNTIMPVCMLALYNMSITKWNYPGFPFLLLSGVNLLLLSMMFGAKSILGLNASSQPEVLSRSSSFCRSENSSIYREYGAISNLHEGLSNGDRRESDAGITIGSSNPMGQLHRKNSSLSQYRSKPSDV